MQRQLFFVLAGLVCVGLLSSAFGKIRRIGGVVDERAARTIIAMQPEQRDALASVDIESLPLTIREGARLSFNPQSEPSDWTEKLGVRQPQAEGFAGVGGTVEALMRNYLALKDAEFPAEIAKPRLPPALNLKQDEFELDDEFEERAKEETAKRQRQIEALQVAYREEVEQRNARLEILEWIAEGRRRHLEAAKSVFLKDAMLLALGGFVFADPKLDKQTGDVLVTLVSRRGDFRQGIAVNTRKTRQMRRAFFKEPQRIAHAETFAVEADGSLRLDKISVGFGDERATGKPADADRKIRDSALTAVIDTQGGEFASIEGLQKQNPNLKDDYKVGTIIYKDGRSAEVKFQDDIPELLKRMKAYPVDRSRWLLVIGAEKYKHTDDILFAKRSAELFAESASRSLGVRPGNVVALYDEQATSGSIKSQVKRLLDNVRQGDTIYFYYNGHGIPAPAENNEPYFLPTDMIPDYVQDEPFFKLKNFYKYLTDSKAGKVIAFMDSCFTGQTDGASVYKGSKAATRLQPKRVTFNKNKMAVLTAGTEKQFSNAYREKGHRLFTYYLIKSLLGGRRDVKNLYREVAVAVSDVSSNKGLGFKQDPVLTGNENLEF